MKNPLIYTTSFGRANRGGSGTTETDLGDKRFARVSLRNGDDGNWRNNNYIGFRLFRTQEKA